MNLYKSIKFTILSFTTFFLTLGVIDWYLAFSKLDFSIAYLAFFSLLYFLIGLCLAVIFYILLNYIITKKDIKTKGRNYPSNKEKTVVEKISVICFFIIICGIILIFLSPRLSFSKLLPSKDKLITTKNRPNVILITLDTLRRDHMSSYGYGRKTTPNLDKIAGEGFLFDQCISPSSWTLPAHVSLMTSTYPSTHGVNSVFDDQKQNSLMGHSLSKDLTTLAEMFLKNEYLTAGFVGGSYCSSIFGLDKGFQYYNDRLYPNFFIDNPFLSSAGPVLFNKAVGKTIFLKIIYPFLENYFNKYTTQLNSFFVSLCNFIYKEHFIINSNWEFMVGQKRAQEINSVLFPWIEGNKDKPFFIFINYFDPHNPYDAPPPFDNIFVSNFSVRVKSDYNIIAREEMMPKVNKGEFAVSNDLTNYLISLYDQEIAYLDFHIGKLFAKLEELKLDKNTIVIITSDHGEGFFEHKLLNHGHTLYEELIRVPLIIWYPANFQKPKKITNQVNLIDIMPTILDMLGITSFKGMQGKSFYNLILDSNNQGQTYTYSELFRNYNWVKLLSKRFDRNLTCIRSIDWKYIHSSNGGEELYFIKEDQLESNNVIISQKEIAVKMRKELHLFMNLTKDRKLSEKVIIDEETKEKLKALGYIQ